MVAGGSADCALIVARSVRVQLSIDSDHDSIKLCVCQRDSTSASSPWRKYQTDLGDASAVSQKYAGSDLLYAQQPDPHKYSPGAMNGLEFFRILGIDSGT